MDFLVYGRGGFKVMDPKDRKVFRGPFKMRVKGNDIVNVKQLYTFMHEWFVEEEYAEDEEFFPEQFYYEMRFGKVRNYFIMWHFAKHPFGEEFTNRSVEVWLKFMGIQDVELQHGNSKIKTTKGTVEIKTWWYLDYDCKKEWRNHWLLKHFLESYVHRWYRKEFEMKRLEVMRDMQAFQAALKEYFHIFSFRDENPDIKRIIGLEEDIS